MAKRLRVAITAAAIAAALLGTLIAVTATGGDSRTVNSGTGSGGTGSSGAGDSGTLNLPRIPWEGGPAYWKQFPVARAAGWSNPGFFPIVMWFDSVNSNAEVQADKSYGINTYIGEPLSTNYNLYADNNAFVLDRLDNTPPGGTAQPGTFIIDEPDGGGPSSAADLSRVRKLIAASPNDGRFKYINFSATVLSKFYPGINKANFEAMMTSYAGPVSVDKYYYTQPSCFDISYLFISIDPAHCRTASSYGATVRAVRARLIATGHLKPVWNFIEDLSGAPDPNHFHSYIQPGQLEGAVMDSIINEARGILYFNQSFAGTCTGTNVIRQVLDGSLPCAQPQMNAMKQVDQQIKSLAPVINTQSYQYSFGSDLDTMLKTYRGSAYIFAMINGNAGSWPGKRTFTLPPGLARATSVRVLFENRTVPVIDGKFTDNFANEYTYHIYKVVM